MAGLLFLFYSEQKLVLNYAPVEPIDTLTPSDCGVVLTGASGRIREAFEILNQKKINKLIISGVYKNTKLSEIFALLPYYPDINADDIVLEKISGSTFENSIQSLGVVETLKCKNIILITSQLHMYRAYKMFKANFPKDYEIKKYPVVNPNKEALIWDEFLECFKSLFYSLTSFHWGL